MKELMIHVERIVNPVSAIQGRKLRMRRELLAHLQATLEEERRRFPGDEQAAFEQAKLRLGEPARLTQELQQTVPTVERMLLTRLPISRRLEHLEQLTANVPGQRGPMTLGHKVILGGMATLSYEPLLMSMYSALASSGMQVTHYTVCMLGALTGWYVILLASYRFVFEIASADERCDWQHILKRGAAILALQIGLMFFLAVTVADRAATIGEVVICAASTIAILAASTLVARRIGTLRIPYDEWLMLNIAE